TDTARGRRQLCFFKNAALGGTKGSIRVSRNLRVITTLGRCGRPPRSTPGSKTRTAADVVAIFDLIAGCDPADPVSAASQGKRADSYLRFLDKDGVRRRAAGRGAPAVHLRGCRSGRDGAHWTAT